MGSSLSVSQSLSPFQTERMRWEDDNTETLLFVGKCFLLFPLSESLNLH